MKKINILNKIKPAFLERIIWGFVIIFIVIINITYTNARVENVQSKYVLTDTNAISKRFIASIIRANLPDNQYQNILLTFDKTLTKVIKNVSVKNNFIVLKESIVLSELPDITAEVERIVWKEMKLDDLLIRGK